MSSKLPPDDVFWLQEAIRVARSVNSDVDQPGSDESSVDGSSADRSSVDRYSVAGSSIDRSPASLEAGDRHLVDLPVGCVIVLNGEIIGRGANLRERTGDPTAHAEIVAMREAAKNLKSWRLSGATMYTTLEPCAMCAEAAIQARVEKIVFGAYDPKSGACGSMFNLFRPGRIYPIPEVIGGIKEEECQKLLVEHFRKHMKR